ncbi:MAG TPA: magnesium transporter [Firmicutes bacterium]|jgi:magnesium transporter|nr:magnesium transporter [Bacillota bacterium]
MAQMTLEQQLLAGNISRMVKLVGRMHPADVAEALIKVPLEKQVALVTVLPDVMGALVLQEMALPDEAALLMQLKPEKAAAILTQMYTDEAADVLAIIPPEDALTLLALMGAKGTQVKKLLAYESDTSGGLMATEFITIQEEQTIEEVLRFLREHTPPESAYYLYVESKDRRLVGVVSLRTLVTKPLSAKVKDVMYREVISVPEDMDQEEVAHLFDKYSFLVLPVVDEKEHLLGVITLDDVLDVAEEEATEDIHKTASIIPMKEAYLDAGIWTLFSKRILWLLSLILINVVSSQVMARYEQVLSTAIALTFFIPMLIGTGGNTGSQSAALVVRALVTGDIQLADWGRVFWKELVVGAVLGFILGLASSVMGLWRGGPAIGLVVGLTMVAVVLFSNLLGMLLPFILTRLRIDPTVASSPLITSICDAAGLVIYFSIATLILRF